MGLDRFVVFLSALCLVYAAETTMDVTSAASTSTLPAGTDVTEQVITTNPRTAVKKNVPTTDTPLDNEIEVEERATSAATRATEEAPQVKELPTTKSESTTVEAEEVLEKKIMTNPPPSTERFTTTEPKEAKEPSQRQTTQAPSQEAIVTITPGPSSPKPTIRKKNKIRQKLTTTTTTPPSQGAKTEEILQQIPTASNVMQEVTSKPFSSADKKSADDAKKGTINIGSQHHSKRRKPSKKDNGMSSLMYIPFMIQAQMIPMMIMQLKFFALKALAIGKLALLILGLNLLRNAIIGYHNDEQQYEQESLASAHYGYNGGPEYGSWINRRMYRADPAFVIPKQIPVMESRKTNENQYTYHRSRLNRSQGRFSNNPYRGYENQMIMKTR